LKTSELHVQDSQFPSVGAVGAAKAADLLRMLTKACATRRIDRKRPPRSPLLLTGSVPLVATPTYPSGCAPPARFLVRLLGRRLHAPTFLRFGRPLLATLSPSACRTVCKLFRTLVLSGPCRSLQLSQVFYHRRWSSWRPGARPLAGSSTPRTESPHPPGR